MRTWLVKTNGDPDDAPLISITSADRTVTLAMSSPDPVAITTRKAEEIRWALGAAIADARADSREDSRE